MSPVTVVINKILLGWVAFGAGFAVAGGFIAFISLIGIVTRLAGITKTADHIPVYENSMAMGILLLIYYLCINRYFPGFFLRPDTALYICQVCLQGFLQDVLPGHWQKW